MGCRFAMTMTALSVELDCGQPTNGRVYIASFESAPYDNNCSRYFHPKGTAVLASTVRKWHGQPGKFVEPLQLRATSALHSGRNEVGGGLESYVFNVYSRGEALELTFRRRLNLSKF